MLEGISPSKGLQEQLDGHRLIEGPLDASVHELRLWCEPLTFPYRPMKRRQEEAKQRVLQDFEVMVYGGILNAGFLGDRSLVDDFAVHLGCQGQELAERFQLAHPLFLPMPW